MHPYIQKNFSPTHSEEEIWLVIQVLGLKSILDEKFVYSEELTFIWYSGYKVSGYYINIHHTKCTYIYFIPLQLPFNTTLHSLYVLFH